MTAVAPGANIRNMNQPDRRALQREPEPRAASLVGVEEAEPEFGAEYQQVIDGLRNGGREALAGELIEMLRNCREDPEEAESKLPSLRNMARLLIERSELEDPIAGPSPDGVMQAEWRIAGDGLLVMAFLEDDVIHCVVQADADAQGGPLYRSERLSEKEALEEFGHLVPLRKS